MKIIVEDTNIIIDLFNTGLLQFCKKMDIEFHTTEFVIKEIKRPEQRSTLKGLISNEELKMVVFNIEEMLQLANLEEECRSTNNLSTADCSVVLLAERLGCRLLTADQKLVHFAQSRGLGTSGFLWLTDKMVEKGIVSPKDMVEYLNRYLETNKRAPEKEVNERIAQYNNTKK
ncbi:MAG: hypothetical protein PUD79_03670 [Prevotellaceae bacterium]|nr:hypothetical protein [Prevotellaceae bacterium]